MMARLHEARKYDSFERHNNMEGEIASLRRFKDDVPEVAAGYECGIGLSDFQDLKDGDIIETFDEKQIEIT